MERVTGRSDDMLIIRGVNVFPSQIEAVLAAEERLSPHYLIELRRPERLDETRRAGRNPRRNSPASSRSRRQPRWSARPKHLIKGYVGVTCAVRVVEPGTIERSQGKAKRVIDRRPKT